MTANLDFSTFSRPSTVLTAFKKHIFYESLKACFLKNESLKAFVFFAGDTPLDFASLDIRSQKNGIK